MVTSQLVSHIMSNMTEDVSGRVEYQIWGDYRWQKQTGRDEPIERRAEESAYVS